MRQNDSRESRVRDALCNFERSRGVSRRARPWSTFFNVLPASRESAGLVRPSVRLGVAERRHLGEIKSNPECEWPGSTLKNVLHGPSASAKYAENGSLHCRDFRVARKPVRKARRTGSLTTSATVGNARENRGGRCKNDNSPVQNQQSAYSLKLTSGDSRDDDDTDCNPRNPRNPRILRDKLRPARVRKPGHRKRDQGNRAGAEVRHTRVAEVHTRQCRHRDRS